MENEKIVLAHGSGGSKSADLFQTIFQPAFNNQFLNEAHDGAILDIAGQKLAFSTDTFVVNPIFFPGGNIGDLAINGTVNDIAMCGAEPLYLSAGFVLEEGFEISNLERIVKTMAIAADKADIKLVTGDTKVVERGAADKIYINTSGIGVINYDGVISPKNAAPGDAIIINGYVGDHGIAVLTEREGFDFTSNIVSDTTALNHMVKAVLRQSSNIHVLRDPTRGGLAGTLNEIASSANLGVELDETKIPVHDQVKSVSEILGIDPLYIANEGKLIIIVPETEAEAIITTMSQYDEGKDARVIGKITEKHPGQVILRTSFGTARILDMPVGERLPRIC